jgi:hypothetical protein
MRTSVVLKRCREAVSSRMMVLSCTKARDLSYSNQLEFPVIFTVEPSRTTSLQHTATH